MKTSKNMLVFVAHPDDAEYFAGGAIARWVGEGARVHYMVVTKGEKGTNDIHSAADELQAVREREQRVAAEVLGVTDVMFLEYPDSELSFVKKKKLRGDIVREIRRIQPDVVVTHDPLVRLQKQHPDHRVVGEIVRNACFPISALPQCESEQITQEDLAPWQPDTLLQFGTDTPNYFVDISDTLEKKIAALHAHTSQKDSFGGPIETKVREDAQRVGIDCGMPAAEAFLLVVLNATV